MALITCGGIHEDHERFSDDSRGRQGIFMCLAALLCEQFSRALLHEIFFFLSVFSSSEVLGKITSIRSKLPTAACWSQEEKRGNCEANLLYVESDSPETNHSQKSSPVEALNLIVKSKSQPVEIIR